MRTLLIACLLMVAPTASGGSLIIYSAPSSLPGFEIYTVLIETDPGEVLRGVDAEFRGPMNQINPLGIPSVFNDNNAFFQFVGAEENHDSQFLFNSADVLSIGDEESDTLLKSAISRLASLDLPNPTPIAQIVIDSRFFFPFVRGGDLDFRLAFDLGGPEPVVFTPFPPPPEPTTATLLILGVMGGAMRRW